MASESVEIKFREEHQSWFNQLHTRYQKEAEPISKTEFIAQCLYLGFNEIQLRLDREVAIKEWNDPKWNKQKKEKKKQPQKSNESTS
jgi:hypothetical protein